jgi:hypothetical protein
MTSIRKAVRESCDIGRQGSTSSLDKLANIYAYASQLGAREL